jgi:hypothetical protein
VKKSEILPEDIQNCSFVGSLLYLSFNTRHDVSYAVVVLSRFTSTPREQHLKATKYVIRYQSKLPGLGLLHYISSGTNLGVLHHMPVSSKTELHFRVFVYAECAGDTVTRNSTSGMFIAWGVHSITNLIGKPAVLFRMTEIEARLSAYKLNGIAARQVFHLISSQPTALPSHLLLLQLRALLW